MMDVFHFRVEVEADSEGLEATFDMSDLGRDFTVEIVLMILGFDLVIGMFWMVSGCSGSLINLNPPLGDFLFSTKKFFRLIPKA